MPPDVASPGSSQFFSVLLWPHLASNVDLLWASFFQHVSWKPAADRFACLSYPGEEKASYTEQPPSRWASVGQSVC